MTQEPLIIICSGVTALIVSWKGNEGNSMIAFTTPIRNTCPLTFKYQFLDLQRSPIDLSGYTGLTLQIKRQGYTLQTQGGSFTTPGSGIVSSNYTPTGLGIWQAQFFATDGNGKRIPGEPIQFRVVANEEDLALSELAEY